jgi:hypothetical protein
VSDNNLKLGCTQQAGKAPIVPSIRDTNNRLSDVSLRAGQRGCAVMSLIHIAKLNGRDPYTYLRDVLNRKRSFDYALSGDV